MATSHDTSPLKASSVATTEAKAREKGERKETRKRKTRERRKEKKEGKEKKKKKKKNEDARIMKEPNSCNHKRSSGWMTKIVHGKNRRSLSTTKDVEQKTTIRSIKTATHTDTDEEETDDQK